MFFVKYQSFMEDLDLYGYCKTFSFMKDLASCELCKYFISGRICFDVFTVKYFFKEGLARCVFCKISILF